MPPQPPTPPENPPGWAAPGGPPPTPPGWGPPPAAGGPAPYGQPGPSGEPPPGQAPYGQAPYGQAPYGQAGGPYGQAPYGQAGGPYAAGAWGYGYVAPQNDKGATTALVLGIVGLLCCGLAGAFAIYEGIKSRRRIAESNGLLTGEGMALAGIILGAIAVVWMVVAVILFLVVIPISSSSGSP